MSSYLLRLFCVLFFCKVAITDSQDIVGCGGFIKSEVEINFSVIEVKLYTKQGSLKYQTDCAPNNGYYMVPVYDKGDYILKVEPPPGWTFEPKSVELSINGKTDKCSSGEDINFQFTGFGIVGKVVSRGQLTGPQGVQLALKKVGDGNDVVQQTSSSPGGDFVFEKVLPGDYVIAASRSPWIFDVSSVAVKVDRETGSAGSVLTVAGFDVQGNVLSDGEPVRGVNFVLFSPKTSSSLVASGCDASVLKDLPTPDGYRFLCQVSSDADGQFVFGSVPCGQYLLVPFYKGEHIKFDVMPNRLPLSVEHDSVVIADSFHVAGFSVSGHILESPKGSGVVGARIIIGGRHVATTQQHGMYHLDSMKPGSYDISVEAPRMTFDVVAIKVTPNTPQLPSIIPSTFEVCGMIEMSPLAVHSRTVRVTNAAGELADTASALNDGTFCVHCKPGVYQFSVELLEADVKAGLKLSPAIKEVTVVDRPVDGIRFVQYRAKIGGAIHCLAECGELQLMLQSVGRTDEVKTTQASGTGQVSVYSFENIVPGKYRVSVISDEWCWKSKSVDVEVVDRDLTSVDFTQTGFMLSASLSHSILLNFTHEKRADTVGSFNLTKGINKFCLADSGVYQLTPVSCHQFERSVYTYDTNMPSVLSLVAVKHSVEGAVTVSQRQTDITVTVRSGDDESVIGPLTADNDVSVTEHQLLVDDNTTKPVQPKQPSGPFVYRFQLWASGGEKLEFVPASSQLLFAPTSVDVVVDSDKCMGVVAAFEGRIGMFIDGQIHPPLDGVDVTVTSPDGIKITEVLSDEAGEFRVGPLDSQLQYSVTAAKEGFTFSPTDDGIIGHFRSFKLGSIQVHVVDGSVPLAGVLLSLSGSGSYRQNNVTPDSGLMQFTSLSPADYYLRVMMREYQFEPASQMISVVEGDTVQVQVTGRRVEYSCFGTVQSLNGEPEPSVYIEAVTSEASPQSCRRLQEESQTEVDGTFRIRGLQPGCEYTVQLKSGDFNVHIERSMPHTRHIKLGTGDVAGVSIIAFRWFSQMDISGNVVVSSNTDHINTLKVYLFKDSSQDSPVHSVSLGPTSFFYLPSVPINNQSYVLKLTSSLSTSTYDYTLPEIQFTANVSYRHFTLRFDAQRKMMEQDLTHSSFMMLPLTIFILFLAYNYQKLVPWLKEMLSSAQMVLTRPSSQPSSAHRQTSSTNESTQSAELLAADINKKKVKTKKI